MINNVRSLKSKHVKVKTARGRKPSSTRWLARQLNDTFVLQAKKEGYRSRAAYKLIEINDKFKILKKDMKILDLGAAPGGWSQVASKIAGGSNILAVDLLEMEAMPGVNTMVKDFCDSDAADVIMSALGGKVDLVMSDMAANTTGHADTDHMRIMILCEKAVELAFLILNQNGSFVAKIFKGGTENSLLTMIKQKFSKVKHFKPKSSRPESSEEYLVATGFRG